MHGSVSYMSIICMAVSCLAGFSIPLLLFLYFRKKTNAAVLPFFTGCGVMLVFAFILEPAGHQLILSSPAGNRINGSIWLYACYGGLMAGLFEETGRFLAFQTVLKRLRGEDCNALMYGAGHGGFEAAVILGISMISNIGLSLLLNSGKAGAIVSSLPEEIVLQMQTAFDALTSTPSYLFLVGIAERIFATVLQIALSVLVWFSVKNPGRRYLFPAAILIHFCVDACVVLLSNFRVPVLFTEGVVLILTAMTVMLARTLWKSENHKTA